MPANNKPEANQELTPIEDKLLDCAKSGKPVLLYGKDTIGRKELVLKIHKRAIETDAPTYTKDPSVPPCASGII